MGRVGVATTLLTNKIMLSPQEKVKAGHKILALGDWDLEFGVRETTNGDFGMRNGTKEYAQGTEKVER
jgi:hypothetical protein